MVWRNVKNHHILFMIRCLLRGVGVSKHFWHMVVLTAIYLINQTLSQVLQGNAPLHILHPASILFPILPHVFGCTCFVQNQSLNRTKLDDKAVRCVFLRYSSISKGYQCYDPVTHHLYDSLDVTFWRMFLFFPGLLSPLGLTTELFMEEGSVPPYPLPILESPPTSPSGSLPSIVTTDPSQIYSRRPHAIDPLPASSPELGIFSPLVSDIPCNTPNPLNSLNT